MTPAPADPRPLTLREAEIRRFVRARYGIRGTFRLHRAALGLDLLRAPVNVMLSPVFLLIKLIAAILGWCGARRASAWLAARQIFLTSDVARQLEIDLNALLDRLRDQGIGPDAPPEVARHAINGYAETRNAVSEITTSLIVLALGFVMFNRATPGVISLAEPIANMGAQGQAIHDFALGSWAGGVWYGLFPAHLAVWQVVLTGVVLSVLASVLTTFAGLIADPVQVGLGTHRRRLMRMLDRLDRHQGAAGVEREHVLARLGDLGDIASSIWRGLR
ncbi:DUF6635 family protein [Paracoccus shanxieyensis]|uniref:Uncharacterized protein n=1 Tax=Paracoccus shanxieyensis TaxID=2675752 RepID=A0A6L6J2B6_9RHOB|nr:DUF6635 family protein [Paracoccus shanxieyensis]MTH65532.1 hypothetical protein [Paracoccus shanxieyensis]MTH88672.1 hypothetical protein [Paracoccus shanxieyensis]